MRVLYDDFFTYNDVSYEIVGYVSEQDDAKLLELGTAFMEGEDNLPQYLQACKKAGCKVRVGRKTIKDKIEEIYNGVH